MSYYCNVFDMSIDKGFAVFQLKGTRVAHQRLHVINKQCVCLY